MAFVKFKLPCTLCPSSDAVSIDENGAAKCFSCGAWFSSYDNSVAKSKPVNYNVVDKASMQESDKIVHISKDDYIGIISGLDDRQIKEDTAKKYNVRVTLKKDGTINEHYYPYYNDNKELIAYKIRKVSEKGFSSRGSIQKATLFGQALFSKGGKYITITEGECDAMAAYELSGSKWPCISIKNGAQSAGNDIKKNLEYLESFDNIIICFDNDKAGRKAALDIASLFKPNKAKIMSLPSEYKDANDMLKAKDYSGFTQSFWNASTYTPAGILRISEKLADWKDRSRTPSISYPWSGLNDKLLGLRGGELVVITGGTGLGKSQVTRELAHHIIKNSEDRIGIIALEEGWRRTVDGLLAIDVNDRLELEEVRSKYSEEDLDFIFNNFMSSDQVYVHAHFGVNSEQDIISKLRYFIVGCDCKWIILDHLHMITATMNSGSNDVKIIDNIMATLRSLAEETGAGIIMVSHLSKSHSSSGHENGNQISLNDLRGSAGIGQLSDAVIALERNQQSSDLIEARTTRLRILKSRYFGRVGVAAQLVYDEDRGRLDEVSLSDSTDLEFETVGF
jgi:twinkle protein